MRQDHPITPIGPAYVQPCRCVVFHISPTSLSPLTQLASIFGFPCSAPSLVDKPATFTTECIMRRHRQKLSSQLLGYLIPIRPRAEHPLRLHHKPLFCHLLSHSLFLSSFGVLYVTNAPPA